MKKTTGEERFAMRQAAKAKRAEAEQKRREKFMRAAIKQAHVAQKKGEVPIGAVIVLNDRIIARAHNQRETKRLATAHAEITAINSACRKVGDWRLNGAEMFVTLEPCAMCAGAIANARISAVYFGAYEKKGGACGSVHNILINSGLNSNTFVFGGILENECSDILKNFFEAKRK